MVIGNASFRISGQCMACIRFYRKGGDCSGSELGSGICYNRKTNSHFKPANEYKKYDFCYFKKCKHIFSDGTTIGCNLGACMYNAMEFERCIKRRGYKIVKVTEK